MTVATQEIIREMVETVVREVNPVAVILFGSHATGSASPDSDVDLLVIEETGFGPQKDRRKEMTRIWNA